MRRHSEREQVAETKGVIEFAEEYFGLGISPSFEGQDEFSHIFDHRSEQLSMSRLNFIRKREEMTFEKRTGITFGEFVRGDGVVAPQPFYGMVSFKK